MLNVSQKFFRHSAIVQAIISGIMQAIAVNLYHVSKNNLPQDKRKIINAFALMDMFLTGL
jgi:hypothetical protein